MFKRTNGYILLVLLVVTGLGSQVSNDTLSSKERRHLVQHLKESRTHLLHSIKDLSIDQLNFTPAPDQWSIREHIAHLLLAEEFFYKKASEAKTPYADTTTTALQTDSGIIATVIKRAPEVQELKILDPTGVKETTFHETLQNFKNNRAQTIKFVRTTTDNIRRHTTKVPFGDADAYQVLLGMSVYTEECLRQITNIKSHPHFPK